MKHKHVLKAALAVSAAAAFAAVPSALATSSAPQVSVRIEGQSKTLLAAKTIQTKPGSITRGGVAPGKCSATTAQGALQDATHGNWTGTWYASYKEYLITGIDGEKPNASKAYWEIFVNNVASEEGACDIKLKRGDKVLFAVVPDKGTEYPLGVSAPTSVQAGAPFTVKVLAYNAKGKPVALKGAKVSFAGKTTTAKGSSITLTARKTGSYTLKVAKHGYVRDETTVTVKGA